MRGDLSFNAKVRILNMIDPNLLLLAETSLVVYSVSAYSSQYLTCLSEIGPFHKTVSVFPISTKIIVCGLGFSLWAFSNSSMEYVSRHRFADDFLLTWKRLWRSGADRDVKKQYIVMVNGNVILNSALAHANTSEYAVRVTTM